MRRDASFRVGLLQGALDVLILRTLLAGPAHGHAIAKQTALILNPVDQEAQ